jgi:chromosome segregation ATPase
MEPDNHTIRLLQEIRDEVRRSSDRSEVRFEVIETTLRELAQQMVLLARGIKTALEHRGGVESRLDSVEQRVDALEKLGGH